MASRASHSRLQGDLGELSAAKWFAAQGATVFVPLNHSRDCDLVALLNGELLRVQVKTSTFSRGGTYEVQLATSGGNQSWTGLVRRFDPARCDVLFVLVGDGRRWCIPATAVGGTRSIVLGGRYSEYEIPPDVEVSESGVLVQSAAPRGDS